MDIKESPPSSLPPVMVGTGEWKVAPQPYYQEMPGLRKLLVMDGNENMNEMFNIQSRGAPKLSKILKWVIDLYKQNPQKLADMIKVYEDMPDTDILNQIHITDIDPNQDYPPDQTIQDAIYGIDDPQAQKDAQELISNTLLGMQEQPRAAPLLNDEITIVDMSRQNSMDRVTAMAEALGFDPIWVAGNPNFDLMVDYMYSIINRIDKIDQFKAFEVQYWFGMREKVHHLNTSQMLQDLKRQSGVDCVYHAVYNVMRAARQNGGHVINNLNFADLYRLIPRDEATGYGNIGNFLGAKGFSEKLGFKNETGDFNIMAAAKLLEAKKGALIARIGRNHEVAILGIRQNPNTKLLEFWVADSLRGGEKPGDTIIPYWKSGRDLIKEVYMQDSERNTQTQAEMILVTWN